VLLLTTSAQPTMAQWAHPHHGRLLTPRHAAAGTPWACDNDGFGALREWARALRSLQRHPHISHGRIDAATVEQLVTLASGGRQVAGDQLTLEIG